MEQNLTNGSVFKNIIKFSLPYLLSYFLQTLYGMADLIIIGRFDGVEGTTAVSIGSQVMHMLTVMIVGLAMGSTVNIGRAVGAGDRANASENIGNTVTLFMSLSAVLTVLLLLLAKPITAVMSTPTEAVTGTIKYLTVCFLGIPFIVAYNIISSVFRGLGDSKSPMYFVATACVVNICLDIVFIGACGMGPLGAALGTTLSQAVSVIVSLLFIKKSKSNISIKKSDLKPKKRTIGRLLRIGIPVSLQDGFIQISFIIITIIANRRGLTDAAAVGIVEKIIGFLFLVPSSMLSTISALGAQNIGAGKPERAVKTMWYAMSIAVSFGVIVSVVMQFAAEPVIGLFTSDKAAVISGGNYMRGYIFDCLFGGIQFCFSGYFCANGRAELSFIHNTVSILAVRIPGAYLMSKLFPETLFPMGLASSAGSLLSVFICLVMFFVLMQKGKNKSKYTAAK